METLQQQKTPQKTSYGSRSSVRNAAIAYPSRTIVHAKLEMTEPGDHDELEADAAANDIVSGGKIRRKISNGGSSGTAVSPQVESQIAQLQGGGHAMPAGLRNMMENGFGRDFSQVRLHTDSQAADMSSSISARAFTHGNDIYFNRGQFSPSTSEGQRLVAHELAHVAQGTGKVGRKETLKSYPEEMENIVTTIKNNYHEIGSKTLVEMIINNLNEYYFDKLLGDLKEERFDFVNNIASADLLILLSHYDIVLKKYFPQLSRTFTPVSDEAIDRLSAENLLILNMLTYLPHRDAQGSESDYIRRLLINSKGSSVRQFINKFGTPDYPLPESWHYEEGETISKEDWKQIFDYIKNNELFDSIIIKDVATDTCGKQSQDDTNEQIKNNTQNKEYQFSILFFNKISKEAIVAYRGTGKKEWDDNFKGAISETTEGQKMALNRYNFYRDELGNDYRDMTVTGHSKGGNKAKYITVKDDSVDRCVSFDGQGFSDLFLRKNRNTMAQNKITNYNTDKDFVNILLNDIGKTYYIQSSNYDKNEPDAFINPESHSPEVMLNFWGSKNRFVQLADETTQDPLMIEIDKFCNSFIRTMEKQYVDKVFLVTLLGDFVELCMNQSDIDLIPFISNFISNYGIRENEYGDSEIMKDNKKNDDKKTDSIAFFLIFINQYMKTHPEFQDMIPYGFASSIIPYIYEFEKTPDGNSGFEFSPKFKHFVSKRKLQHYLELFSKGKIKIAEGEDLVWE